MWDSTLPALTVFICPQAFCLLSSLFGNKITLLEIQLRALIRAQQSSSLQQGLSVVARYPLSFDPGLGSGEELHPISYL